MGSTLARTTWSTINYGVWANYIHDDNKHFFFHVFRVVPQLIVRLFLMQYLSMVLELLFAGFRILLKRLRVNGLTDQISPRSLYCRQPPQKLLLIIVLNFCFVQVNSACVISA